MNKRNQRNKNNKQQQKLNKKRVSRNKHRSGLRQAEINEHKNYKRMMLRQQEEIMQQIREQQSKKEKGIKVASESLDIEQKQEHIQF